MNERVFSFIRAMKFPKFLPLHLSPLQKEGNLRNMLKLMYLKGQFVKVPMNDIGQVYVELALDAINEIKYDRGLQLKKKYPIRKTWIIE